MRKIHCLESIKRSFDNKSIDEVRDMVGFVEPEKHGKKVLWEVTTLQDGCGYTCDNQTEAEILAGIEEIKGLLILLLKKERK